MTALHEAVRLISSEKVKERTDGISQYRLIFGESDILERIKNGQQQDFRWLPVFQSLFTCVLNDKLACVKRGSWKDAPTLSVRRLEESAQLLFWLIERVSPLLSKPVVAPLVNHITQMINFRAEVFTPVALPYLKALRCLFAHSPHLDHLKEQQWKDVAQLCAAVVLHDDLDHDPWKEAKSLEEYKHQQGRGTNSKHVSNRSQQVEAMSCLSSLLHSPYAPLLGVNGVAYQLLGFFSHLFTVFPSDRSIHLPLLRSVNRVLRELYLNKSHDLREFASLNWPDLILLWGSRSRSVKEQVVISFKILLSYANLEKDAWNMLEQLYECIIREVDTRSSVHPISLSSVALDSNLHRRAFQYHFMRAAALFSPADCLAWAVLELGADTLFLLYTKDTSTKSTKGEIRASKRRRTDGEISLENNSEPLFNLWAIGPDANVLQAVWSMQVMVFFFARHGFDLDIPQRRQIQSKLLSLLSSNNEDLQNWTLIALSSMVNGDTNSHHLLPFWQTACSMISRPHLCRAAAFAASNIIFCECITKEQITQELRKKFDDLHVQSNVSINDGLCQFFTNALEFAESTMTFKPEELSNVAFIWLRNCMSDDMFVSGTKSLFETMTPYDLSRLLAAICHSKGLEFARGPLLSPFDSPMLEWMEVEFHTEAAQQFLLHAKLTVPNNRRKLHFGPDSRFLEKRTGGSQIIEKRLLEFLSVALENLWKANDLHSIVKGKVILRNMLNICMAILLFQFFVRHEGSPPANRSTRLESHISNVLNILRGHQWTHADRSDVIKPMMSLCNPPSTQTLSFQVVSPGRGSDVPLKASKSDNHNARHPFFSLSDLWSTMDQHSLVQVFLALEQLAHLNNETSNRSLVESESANDNEWELSSSELVNVYDTPPRQVVVIRKFHIACTTLSLTMVPYLKLQTINNFLSNLVSMTDLHSFVDSTNAMLDHLEDEEFDISGTQKESIVQKVGSDLLMAYNFERDIDVHTLALRFLNLTVPNWKGNTVLQEDAVELIQHFQRLMEKDYLHWTVEIYMAPLLFKTWQHTEKASEGQHDHIETEKVAPSIFLLANKEHIFVRCCAARVISDLYGALDIQDSVKDSLAIYDAILQHLPVDVDNLEMMLSRILTLTNILIACGSVRQKALFHLLELTLITKSYNVHMNVMLQEASTSLGFSEASDLWKSFATQLTWAVFETRYDLEQLPYTVLGYASRLAFAQDSFQPAASIFLAMNTEKSKRAFISLCHLAQKSHEDGVIQCVPFTFISELTLLLDDGATSNNAIGKATQLVSGHLNRFRCKQPASACLEKQLDSIVVELSMRFFDTDIRFLVEEARQEDQSYGHILQKFLYKSMKKDLEPSKPSVSGRTYVKALRSLTDCMPSISEPQVIYNVLDILTSKIFMEHFVNDQLRHVCALQTYAAITWHTISSHPSLLGHLLHNAVALLRESHLFDMLRPIVFECLKKINMPFETLTSDLLAVAQAITVVSHHGKEQESELQNELEDTVTSMLDRGDLQDAVGSALQAWPLAHQTEWNEKFPSFTPATIVHALHHVEEISVEPLRRLLQLLQSQDSVSRRKFFSASIWELMPLLEEKKWDKQNISGLTRIIADILSLSSGQLSPSIYDKAHDTTHTVSNPTNTSGDSVQVLRSCLVSEILKSCYNINLATALRSKQCLKAIFTDSPSFVQEKFRDKNWQSIGLITAFPAPLHTHQVRSISELSDKNNLRKADSFNIWICWFTSYLCELLGSSSHDISYSHVTSIVKNDCRIASSLMPAMLHIFYRENMHDDKHSKAMSQYLLLVLLRNCVDKQVWKRIIDAVILLRSDSPTDTPLSSDTWIHNIDFELLAKRAVDCSLFASAVLFLELSAEHGENAKADNLGLQYEIYSNIEDPDLFYGIQNANVRDSLTKRLEHEGLWDQVFELRAAEYEQSSREDNNLSRALSEQRYDRLAMQVKGSSDIDYELAWRAQIWSVPLINGHKEASKSVYAALRSLYQDTNAKTVNLSVEIALEEQLQNLIMTNAEASKDASRMLSSLLGVREVQNLYDSQGRMDWLDSSGQMKFRHFEYISSVRFSLLQATKVRNQASLANDAGLEALDDLEQAKVSLMLDLSKRARSEGELQIAMKSVTQAQGILMHKSPEVEAEFATILWAQGHHSIAIDALASIVDTIDRKKKKNLRFLGVTLTQLGQWRATARSNHPTTIVADCFRPALEMLKRDGQSTELAEVCHRYASFAESQYRALRASEEVGSLEAFIGHREEEIKQLEGLKQNSRSNPTRNVVKALDTARKMLAMDKAKLAEHEKTRDQFRADAGRLFALELSNADGPHDENAITRLVSLLFENANSERFAKEVHAYLSRIPSRKFLSLTAQISSRVSSTTSGSTHAMQTSSLFRSIINDIVFRMCSDHPFHALYALYALSRGNAEGQAVTRRSNNSVALQNNRENIATKIIDRVKANAIDKNRLQEWQRVCDACVEWSQVDLPTVMPQIYGRKATERKKNERIKIPSHLSILKLRSVKVPVITRNLAIDPTCQYKDVVGIAKYSERFTTAGGIHLPKITDCIGTDGRVYRQLFKDKDDLRQDAVMQQVFQLVNNLLMKDRRAKQRSLKVRTYMVVPLGPQHGLLEFVDNTTPILSPLLDLHARYKGKSHLSPSDARRQLAATQAKSTAEKEEVYRSVCARMPPVFRFYFLERSKDPLTLLLNRLNFTRSVATTSIVGHMLGLGDRHASNILLDQQTGEVVHIDFGVAFDQGRLLPIPELVPFRLTRDIVDGMGLHGIEGVFRRGCEETLRVLRLDVEVIKTVLEVFRYDPLYDWTQNPVKVIRAQATDESYNPSAESIPRIPPSRLSTAQEGKQVTELMAERAINSVISKLSSQLSVEYTVNDLMTRAMDDANLATIFHGEYGDNAKDD